MPYCNAMESIYQILAGTQGIANIPLALLTAREEHTPRVCILVLRLGLNEEKNIGRVRT